MIFSEPRRDGTRLLLLLMSLAAPGALPARPSLAAGPAPTFTNPVKTDAADPYILRDADGLYYYTQTSGDGVYLIASRSLTGVASGRKVQIFRTTRQIGDV
jgi:hypothetical protein